MSHLSKRLVIYHKMWYYCNCQHKQNTVISAECCFVKKRGSVYSSVDSHCCLCWRIAEPTLLWCVALAYAPFLFPEKIKVQIIISIWRSLYRETFAPLSLCTQTKWLYNFFAK